MRLGNVLKFMGHIAIYKCKKCGNLFKSREGGGFHFIEYRCVNCDNIKTVKSDRTVPSEKYKPPTREEIGLCDKCGGELREDLKPMCPACKSREVEEKEILMLYD